jgi:hypothetical protein
VEPAEGRALTKAGAFEACSGISCSKLLDHNNASLPPQEESKKETEENKSNLGQSSSGLRE